MPDSGLLDILMAFRPALFRYLSLRGATADEAEDVLQEMGLKVAAARLGSVDQPRAYFYRMAHNHLLLHRRTTDRRERRDEAWMAAHTGDPPEVDEQPSAEDRLVAREQLSILQHAIDALPDRTRTIFRRFRIDGIPRREIADDLGISVSAVEKHLARAYGVVIAATENSDEGDKASRSLSQEESRHGS